MIDNENIYKINHRFRDEIIVPITAISNNISFLMDKNKRYVELADGSKCEIISFFMKNICDLEEKILSLYRIPAWDFLKKWVSIYPTMTSIEFVVIKLKKENE